MLRIASLAVVGLIALVSVADASPVEEANAYNTLGKAAFKAGKFEECATHFRASYNAGKTPNMLFNEGLCHEKAEKLGAALAAFREYLEVAPVGERAAEAKTRADLLALKLEVAKPKPIEASVDEQDAALPEEKASAEPRKATSVAARSARANRPAVYQCPSDALYGVCEAHQRGWRVHLGIGFAFDDLGGGLGTSLSGGYDLGANGKEEFNLFTLRHRVGARLDHASMESADTDSSFSQFGLEYRATLQIAMIGVFAGAGAGFATYSGFDEEGDDFSLSGLSLQANGGMEFVAIGRYGIGASFTHHLTDGVNAVGLTLSRY